MLSPDTFAASFGGGTPAHLDRVAALAVRNGYAVVPVEPLGKVPLCTLTARAARLADLEAEASGGRKHACGINHAITDMAEAKRVFARMLKERPGLNIGVEVGRSGLVLADADDQAAVEAWTQVWYDQEHADDVTVPSDWAPVPTVLTPGRKLADGTWAHKDGAHFWYRLTEDQLAELPAVGPGSMQLAGGVSLSWRDRQALVPPSVRDEGPYRLVGKVTDCPEWLFDMIVAHIAETLERKATQAEKLATGGPDDIEAWSAATPWGMLLAGVGWMETQTYDSCGPLCAIWTRPGEAGSAKSATAHEPGCTQTGTETGWGPLHVWSDIAAEELGSRHLSKLQFYAVTQHGGDVRAAMAALGLSSNVVRAEEAELARELEDWWFDPRRSEQQAARESETEPSPATPAPGGSGSSGKFSGLFADLQAILDGTAVPSPAPTILTRTDGQALFYRGTLNGLFGEPESGKSWVAMAAVGEVITGGGVAAYLDLDANGAASLVGRLEVMGVDWAPAAREQRLAIADKVHDRADLELFLEAMLIVRPDLVVIDALGDALPLWGAKTDSNDEVTAFLNRLGLMAAAGSAVVTIDHVAKNAEVRGYAIGAQAKKARMDGAYILVETKDGFARGRGGSAYLKKAKDRHGYVAEQSSPKPNELWGTFHLDPEFSWGIVPPDATQMAASSEVAEEHQAEALDRAMVLVSGYLVRLASDAAELGTPDLALSSSNAIRDARIGVRTVLIGQSLERLKDGGYVERVARGRYPAWRSVKPYESLEP